MKISINTPHDSFESISTANGFGYAGDRMVNSLSLLGYECGVNLKHADVEIAFEQPHHIEWKSDGYKIAYVPWESTELPTANLKMYPKDWAPIMNSADEVWTPSPLIAQWFTRAGIVKPVHVYEHGVDADIWIPEKREVDGTFKFLMCGPEALRKGAKETIRAFRLAFPNNKDVSLTLKTTPNGNRIGWIRQINFLTQMLPLNELVALFHSHHAYVYPSYGEGFGLTPLQAMATGMPTITLPAWAPYERFLDDNLKIGSKLIHSPWPALHPGLMFEPSIDDTVDAMRYAYQNYDSCHAEAWAAVDQITTYYDWNRLTKECFESLESRL